nr:MAG TPA: hypothetical protein [Caudoviricetes sp.]
MIFVKALTELFTDALRFYPVHETRDGYGVYMETTGGSGGSTFKIYPFWDPEATVDEYTAERMVDLIGGEIKSQVMESPKPNIWIDIEDIEWKLQQEHDREAAVMEPEDREQPQKKITWRDIRGRK